MATSTLSTGISTTSMFLTPQAVDDFATIIEGSGSSYVFDVMSNDLGGGAKQLWAIVAGAESQVVVNNGDATVTTGEAMWTDLISSDIGSAAEFSQLGAKILIVNGMIAYDVSSTSMQALLNGLSAGQVIEDRITYTIRLGNGTLSMATLTVKLTGTNDGVTLSSGGIRSGSVVEDADQTASLTDSMSASGAFGFDDVDANDSHSATVPVIVWDRGATVRIRAPMRRCRRSQGSNGKPSGRVHAA